MRTCIQEGCHDNRAGRSKLCATHKARKQRGLPVEGRRGKCSVCNKDFLIKNALSNTCSKRCTELRNRFRKYSLTHWDVLGMLLDEDFKCQGCNRDIGINAVIDHDHSCCPTTKSCGKCVRGMLCKPCNTALGYVQDDPKTLLRLAEYVGT